MRRRDFSLNRQKNTDQWAIYHTAVITFKHARVNQELPTVLLIAPTGVAAKNINETTIYTALSIAKESGDNVPPLSHRKKTQLRMPSVI